MKESAQLHGDDLHCQVQTGLLNAPASDVTPEVQVAVLTGGGDRPYVVGLATELISKGAAVDLIGSDGLDLPEFRNVPRLKFLNLRGDQRSNAGFLSKTARVIKYYAKLIRYAATAKPNIFHILWNNKFETFDRTFLLLYYKLLGKRIVLTAHNVNAGRRDSKDTFFNRLTLRIQYRLADHIFVHTEKSKLELIEDFGGKQSRITVIPFGINNTVPTTNLTPSEARQQLGIPDGKKTILFYGRITPYKGIHHLIAAVHQNLSQPDDYRLIIAGRPDRCEDYWSATRELIRADIQCGRVLLREEHIPDSETEIYFKAADVLILPYRHVYQSGVLFLGYSFGLPVLAADVGSLKDDIVEGQTGFVFRPEDPADLAKCIERYFASGLFANLDTQRRKIRDFAAQRHSWSVVGQMTLGVYVGLFRQFTPKATSTVTKSSFNVNTPS